MTDAAGARAPDVDPYGGLGAAPDIDWGEIESDHDDDGARALIAQVNAQHFPEASQTSLETGEIAQTAEERAEAADLDKKQKEADDAEAKRKAAENEGWKKEEHKKKEEDNYKMNYDRGRGAWNNNRGAEGSSDWQAGANKWQRKKKPGKDKIRYTCEICNVETVGEKARDSHLRGKKHMTEARQAKLKSQNEELNRHGARIADQMARRSQTPENDPDSRFQHPDRPNGHNYESARDSAMVDDRRDGSRWEGDGDSRRRDVDPRDFRPRVNEARAPIRALHSRSTDPRPRYFDAMVTSDPKPTEPRVSNGTLPDLDPGDSGADLGRHVASASNAGDIGRVGSYGSGASSAADKSAHVRDDQITEPPRQALQTARPRSPRAVTPDSAPAAGEKPAESDAGPSVPPRAGKTALANALANGKSPFMRTGPKKSSLKPSTSNQGEGKAPPADDTVAAPSVKVGSLPAAGSAAGSVSEGKRPVDDRVGSSSSGVKVSVGGKAGSSQDGKKGAEVSLESAAQGKKPNVERGAGTSEVGITAPRNIKSDRAGDGKRAESTENDGKSGRKRSSEADRRVSSREGKGSAPDEIASRSGDKGPSDSQSRAGDPAEGRPVAPEPTTVPSRDSRRPVGDDRRGSSREERRSPPYDRKSRRDEVSSSDFDRTRARDDRSGRSRPYDRDDSRENRRSPPYDRAAAREERRPTAHDRSSRREERRSPPYDRKGGREQRRKSPDAEGDVREGRRSPPYDRAGAREGKRSPQDERGFSSGDRKRSRYESGSDVYGEARRSFSDSRPSDSRDGRRTPRGDSDNRDEERRKLPDYRGSAAQRSERPAVEAVASSSREKYSADRDGMLRDSPPVPYQREAPPPPPTLKLRSQAVPLKPEDDAKKRRFTSMIDAGRDDTRFKSAPAPYDNRPRASVSGEGNPRFESVKDGSQRRRLLDPADAGSRGKDAPRERSDEELRCQDGSRDDGRRHSSPLERSLPRDSQRYGNADLHRRHTVGPSQPDRAGGQGQKHQTAGPSGQSTGNADTFNPERYGTVSQEYLNEPMSVAEWRELRHFILNEGSDVDKLAYKMMQEIILSPVLGINDTSLAPFSGAMTSSVNKHYVTPKGVFAKLSDYPAGLRKLDPKYSSEAKGDEDWSRHQTPEHLALCQVRDNIDFTFNTNEHATIKTQHATRAEFPPRGSFGVRNQRKGPGVLLEGERPPRYEDAVAVDPLFNQIMNYYSACQMGGRPGPM